MPSTPERLELLQDDPPESLQDEIAGGRERQPHFPQDVVEHNDEHDESEDEPVSHEEF